MRSCSWPQFADRNVGSAVPSSHPASPGTKFAKNRVAQHVADLLVRPLFSRDFHGFSFFCPRDHFSFFIMNELIITYQFQIFSDSACLAMQTTDIHVACANSCQMDLCGSKSAQIMPRGVTPASSQPRALPAAELAATRVFQRLQPQRAYLQRRLPSGRTCSREAFASSLSRYVPKARMRKVLLWIRTPT
jgi:hypothetical protein